MRRMRDRRVITLAVQANPTNASLMSSYANALGRPARKITILWQADTDTATFVINDYIQVKSLEETTVDETIDYRVEGTTIDAVGFNLKEINGPIYSIRMTANVLAVGAAVDILCE